MVNNQPAKHGTEEMTRAPGHGADEEVDDVLNDERAIDPLVQSPVESGGGSRISLSASCSRKSFIVYWI